MNDLEQLVRLCVGNEIVLFDVQEPQNENDRYDFQLECSKGHNMVNAEHEVKNVNLNDHIGKSERH